MLNSKKLMQELLLISKLSLTTDTVLSPPEVEEMEMAKSPHTKEELHIFAKLPIPLYPIELMSNMLKDIMVMTKMQNHPCMALANELVDKYPPVVPNDDEQAYMVHANSFYPITIEQSGTKYLTIHNELTHTMLILACLIATLTSMSLTLDTGTMGDDPI